jgi:hypothetical protein
VVGFLARAAACGVLVRRGPRAWVQLIHWDTATDQWDAGQWFRGRIDADVADLSPDGRLFLYGAAKYGTPADPTYTHRWTAISRPPYYTALALWPQGQLPNAMLGGLFTAARVVALNTPAPAHPAHPPQGLVVGSNAALFGGDYGSTRDQRLHRHGWIRGPAPAAAGFGPARGWLRAQPGAAATLFTDPAGRFVLSQDAGVYPLAGATWADWDQQGRLVFTRQGRLLTGTVLRGSWRDTELADFTAAQPAALPPPLWATRW